MAITRAEASEFTGLELCAMALADALYGVLEEPGTDSRAWWALVFHHCGVIDQWEVFSADVAEADEDDE